MSEGIGVLLVGSAVNFSHEAIQPFSATNARWPTVKRFRSVFVELVEGLREGSCAHTGVPRCTEGVKETVIEWDGDAGQRRRPIKGENLEPDEGKPAGKYVTLLGH